MSTPAETSPVNTDGGVPNEPDKHPIPKPHPAVFRIGVMLMLASFLVYPGYGWLATMALSPTVRLEVGVAAWAASWGSFALGSALAGAEGVEFLRRLFRRR